MNEADVIDLLRGAIWVVFKVSGPALIAAMVVGLGIALLQALTQIQEMTLTFVPKIAAILLTIAIALPFMYEALASYTDNLTELIATRF